MAPKILQIPFGAESHLLMAWPPKGEENAAVVFKDNFVFNEALEFVGFAKGASGAALFKIQDDKSGLVMQMSSVELARLLRVRLVNYGLVRGAWTFTKRGKKFSLSVVVS